MVRGLYGALAQLMQWGARPLLWWRGRRLPALRERWDERVARVPWPAARRAGVVVHAASMGEVSAAAPLVEALLAARPDLPLTFTCSTPTGSALIRERFGDRVGHLYLPFDTRAAVRRFLDGLSPRMLVLLETELWPQLLREARRRGVAVVLANARLSQRSADRYARFRTLTQGLLCDIDLLLAQDADTLARFRALGAAPARMRLTGSLKFDTPLPPDIDALRARFRALAAGRTVWVAASTREGEEAAVLEALAALRARWPDLLLVLVPRHPQRFEEVAALLEERGLRFQRRSRDEPCRPDTAVLLGDSMGELRAWFGEAAVVFMGGTLAERGGHNPLEVMQFGAPLVAGPHVFNFAAPFAALAAGNALVTVRSADELARAVDALLADPPAAAALGARGRALFEREGGATARSLEPMLALLQRQSGLVAVPQPDGEIWADPEVFPQPQAALFDPGHWQGRGDALGQASGRATAWFVRHGARELVLRHYYRGGLMGRLVKDRFLAEPVPDTRAMAEHALLRRMRSWGLPVPRPCAARVQRVGPHYRADILVERIPGAEDLSRRLVREALPAEAWHAVGAAVAALHAHGVHHSDLNCHNLLIDLGQRIWIVDFDKCEARAPGPWMQDNLERLRRSLRKERTRQPAWHWQESDWPALVEGYERAREGWGR